MKKISTIPYTYLVIHKTTGLAYYGVRYANGCNPTELWKKYFTSSKPIKSLIEIYGVNDFIYEIRRIFSTKAEAIKWEKKVNLRITVKSNKFLNQKAYVDNSTSVDTKFIFIKNDELGKSMRWKIDIEIPSGWVRGKLGDTNNNKKWINNGVEEKMIPKEDIIPNDWVRGTLKRIPYHNPITKDIIQLLKADEIPVGFVYGNGYDENHPSKNKIYAYCPDTLKISNFKEIADIPNGWIKGVPKSGLKDKISIFNSQTLEEVFINKNDNIPDGWLRGKPSLTKRKIAEKTLKCVNHETNEILIVKNKKEIPDGFQPALKGRQNTWVKGTKWYTNKITGETKMLNPDIVDTSIWVLGREIK